MRHTELAVLNNIHWYQALFAAHGLASTADDLAWYSLEAPPPFHSNLVVRARDASVADIEALLDRIATSRPAGSGYGLKDSHANLDLAHLGLQVLFSASWLWLAPEDAAAQDEETELDWRRIGTAAELAGWEHAWAGAPANQLDAPAPRQFPESLLFHPDFAFLAGWRHGQIVAGGIVNRSPGAAGLSNFFCRTEQPRNIWPALIRLARGAFAGLALTGYDRGVDLRQALQAGFRTVGDLRVWYRPSAG